MNLPDERSVLKSFELHPDVLEPLSPDYDLLPEETAVAAVELAPVKEEIIFIAAEEEKFADIGQEAVLPPPVSPAPPKGRKPAEIKKAKAGTSSPAPVKRLPAEGEKSGAGNEAKPFPASTPEITWDAAAFQEGTPTLQLLSLKDWEAEMLSADKRPASPLSAVFSPAFTEKKVEDSIAFFQQKGGTFFSNALARSQAYEDMMKKIFREKNLPEELFYLALIESGYNPHALSRSKAGGIWQFINKTAKRFGLKVDKWVDERRDPEKSTYAAAEYLKILYEMFNCWDLATAGYNAGEGKVLRAMKKANSQDFWEISQHQYLKKETKRYVPLFLAAVLIAKDPQKYGFANIDYHPPLVYEKVMVPPSTRLDLIARAAGTDLSEIRALNPALKREKTPPGLSPFEIKLPPGKKELFEKNLFSFKRLASTKDKKYRVRPGETLSSIAKRHGVRWQDLCELNGFSARSKIKPGTLLLLPQ